MSSSLSIYLSFLSRAHDLLRDVVYRFARIEEFYRVLSEKDFPGKMRIRWYYHSKSETASGSFGHDQELYKSDSFDDVHISSLRTKVSVKYFSDGPVDGFDFFCRYVPSYFSYARPWLTLCDVLSRLSEPPSPSEDSKPTQRASPS